jgi:hypothetical protein
MINVQVRNLDKVKRNLQIVKNDLPRYINAGGLEIAAEILDTQGLRRYPPGTSANQPPPPYYIRGRGTQLAGGNLGNSERLGSRWQTKPIPLGIKIYNDASYAKWVNGRMQARAMARIGWMQLEVVAGKKVKQIRDIFEKWIGKLIKDKGL